MATKREGQIFKFFVWEFSGFLKNLWGLIIGQFKFSTIISGAQGKGYIPNVPLRFWKS